MGENSAIEWTDHTFNPWTGCLKVSPGCDHCYAADIARRAPRTFGSWLPGGPRKRTSDAYWRQPIAWNRKAEREGVRRRVFCASMADVFDNQVPAEWREDLWALIHDTPHLDWLLLTKRPQNIAKMLPGTAPLAESSDHARAVWGAGWPNVLIGTTVENQAEADRRIPHLVAVPAKVRFLSCEPLLGAIDLTPWLRAFDYCPLDSAEVNGCDGVLALAAAAIEEAFGALVAVQEPGRLTASPLDIPLPADLKFPGVTFRKGVTPRLLNDVEHGKVDPLALLFPEIANAR